MGGKRTGLAEPGDKTTWSARFFGLRFRLTTRLGVTDYARPHRFSDVQCAGLFRHFGHVYTFETPGSDGADGSDQTLLTDAFSFESPFGVLGALLDRWVLRPRMQRVADARIAFLQRTAENDGPEGWRSYLTDAPRL